MPESQCDPSNAATRHQNGAPDGCQTALSPASPGDGPAATLEQQIDALSEAARRGDADEARRRLKALATEYNPPELVSPASADRAAPAQPDTAAAIIPPANGVVEAMRR